MGSCSIPLAWPRAVDERLIASLAMGLMAASLAKPSLLWTHVSSEAQYLPELELAIPTGIISVVLTYVAMSTRYWISSAFICLLLTWLGGALNTAYQTGRVVIVRMLGEGPDTLVGAVEAFLLAAMLVAPLSFLFGLVYLPLITFAARMRGLRTEEGRDFVMIGSGIWLLGAALVRWWLSSVRGEGDAAAWWTGAVGVVLAGVGAQRALARRSWLARLQNDHVGPLALSRDVTDASADLPCLFLKEPRAVRETIEDGPLFIVSKEAPLSETPYRHNDAPRVLARLSAPRD